MSVIMNDHWTILVQCTIMVPVSSIFLQENRFKPANRGLFFIHSLRIPVFPAFVHACPPASARHFSLG